MKVHVIKTKSLIKNETISAWGYLMPVIILFAIFWFYPIFMLIYDSFFEWDGLSERIYIGFQNYEDLFRDTEFWLTVKNTFIFILGSVPVGMILGLLLALLLKDYLLGKGIFRTIIFAPVATSKVAAGLIWIWLLNFDYGILNMILINLGLEKIPWLVSDKYAMLSIIMMTLWKDAGYNMVLFLGGLYSIDETCYEAASIDGGNRWQVFWGITWPLLLPTTFFILITRIIFTFRAFEEIYAMTKGGPAGATTVFVYYIYEKAFQNFELGYASAASIILLFVVLLFTFVQFKLIKFKY